MAGRQTEDKAMFAEERRQIILEALARDRRVTVNGLSERFGVSRSTLRNDLQALEEKGLLRRTYGGAVALDEQHAYERPSDESLMMNAGLKRAIAERAAQMVSDGDTLFCDNGSTMCAFMRALAGRRDLTVITSDLNVAAEAERVVENVDVIFIGGTLRRGFHYIYGAMAVDMARRFTAPVAFLSASGFTEAHGFSVSTTDTAMLKRCYIEQAERTVMLFDSSKFGAWAAVSFAEPADMATVVTDAQITDENRELLVRLAPETELVVAE